MIIFTEHDEVVMSVSDMRNLIRESAKQAAQRAESDCEPTFGGECELKTPVTFICENVLEILERRVRETRSPQYEP